MKTNEDLRKDVMDEIKWDLQLKDVCTQIQVSAKDGIVTLSGLVDTYTKKDGSRAGCSTHSGR